MTTPDPKLLFTGTEKILIVENDLLVAALWRQILIGQGYDVSVSSDSPKTLERFRQASECFDLVIMDWSKPQLAGDCLAAEMITVRKDLPIILCSDNSKKIYDERSKEKDNPILAEKPIMREELIRLVRKTLHACRL